VTAVSLKIRYNHRLPLPIDPAIGILNDLIGTLTYIFLTAQYGKSEVFDGNPLGSGYSTMG
jgi:hypothetical protein